MINPHSLTSQKLSRTHTILAGFLLCYLQMPALYPREMDLKNDDLYVQADGVVKPLFMGSFKGNSLLL